MRVEAAIIRRWSPPLLLFALLFLLYLPSLDSELIYDSKNLFAHHPVLTQDLPLVAVFTHGYLEKVGMGLDRGVYYRPLTLLSFVLEKRLWGIHAPWLRGVNLGLFFLALAGVWRLFGRLFAEPAAVAPLVFLFALHPLHADNIVWAVGRSDLLLLLWGVAALLILDLGHGRWRFAWIAAAVCTVAALLSKESAVFLLPVFALFEWIRHRRLTRGFYLVSGGLALGFFALKAAVLQTATVHYSLAGGFWFRLREALGSLGYYAQSLIRPQGGPSFLTPEGAVSTGFHLWGAACILALAILSFLALRHAPALPPLALMLIFFAAHLVLVFTPLYPFRASSRYLVFPLLGAVWLIGVHFPARRKPLWIGLILLLAVSYMPETLARGARYHDETAFWRALHGDFPGNGYIASQLGAGLMRQGEVREAEVLLRGVLDRRMDVRTAANTALLLADIEFARACYHRAEHWLATLDRLPAFPEMALRRGRLRVRTLVSVGETVEAEAELIALERRFAIPDLPLMRWRLHLGRCDWRAAGRVERHIRAVFPGVLSETTDTVRRRFESGGPRERLGHYIAYNNYAAAADLLRSFPAGPERDLQLAKVLHWQGREEEATATVADLVAGGDDRLLNRVGRFYLEEMGRDGEALRFFRRSLKRRPDQPAVQHLVEILGKAVADRGG